MELYLGCDFYRIFPLLDETTAMESPNWLYAHDNAHCCRGNISMRPSSEIYARYEVISGKMCQIEPWYMYEKIANVTPG